MRVAVAEGIARCILGELLRSRAVSFREQWRQVLRIVLIFESIHEIFGWKLVRGSSLVT